MRCGSRESHPDRHGHLPLLSDGDGICAARRARQRRPSRESPEGVVAWHHATARGIGPIAVDRRSGLDGGSRTDCRSIGFCGPSIGFESAHAELLALPEADSNPIAAGAADRLTSSDLGPNPNSNSGTNADAYANAHTDPDPYSNANPDTNPNTDTH